MLLAIVSSNSNMVVKAARNGPLPSRAVVAKTIACPGASRHSSYTMGPESVSTIQRRLDIPFTGKGRDAGGDATRFSIIAWIEPEVAALIDRGIRSLIEQADDGIFKKVLACVNYLFSNIFQNTRASCKRMILSTATQQKPLPSLIGCRFICWAIRSISDPSGSSQCTTTDRTMTRV